MLVMVEYDSRARATYLSLGDREEPEHADRTDLVREGEIHVDLDENSRPVGVELLMAPADLTTEILAPLFEHYPDLRAPITQALTGVGYKAAA